MKEITKILYENSSDTSEGLLIKFEKIHDIILLLGEFIKEQRIQALHDAAIGTFYNK